LVGFGGVWGWGVGTAMGEKANSLVGSFKKRWQKLHRGPGDQFTSPRRPSKSLETSPVSPNDQEGKKKGHANPSGYGQGKPKRIGLATSRHTQIYDLEKSEIQSFHSGGVHGKREKGGGRGSMTQAEKKRKGQALGRANEENRGRGSSVNPIPATAEGSSK